MKCCRAHGRRCCTSCLTFTFGFYAEHIVGRYVFPFSWLTKVLGL